MELANLVSQKNIVLVGMPGSGKTTIGKLLSEKLSMEYIDTDDLIEKNESMTISNIFKTYGEPHFRMLETKVAETVGSCENKVIATGGGMILKKENMTFLKGNGVIFFLDRPMDHIFDDIDENIRPLLKDNRQHLYNLYKERYPLYCDRSDYKIINNKSVELIIDKIEKLWMKLGE